MSKGFSVQPLCCLQTPDSCLHSRGSSWAKIPVRRAKSSASVQVAQVESAQTSGRFAQATSSSRRPLSPFSRRPRSVREENAEEKRIRKKSSRDTPEGSDPLRVRVQGGSRARVGVTIQSRGADHRSPGKWSSVTFKCCCCFSSPFFEGKVPEQSILELFIHLSDPGRVRNSPEGGKKKITQQASNHAG